ncbi:hypothetical protein UACE39S_01964 [Ureibacillus acetophenoni]
MTWSQLQSEQEVIFLKQKKLERLKFQKENITNQINKIGREIQAYTNELNVLKEKLQHLDTFSFINLYRSWTGKKEELRVQKIDKAAAIEMKIIESERMQADLTNDLTNINNELLTYNESQLKNQLEIVLIKKENWLKENQPEKAIELQQLEEDKLNCKKLNIEIEEAREAGNNAITQLYNALDSLNSASDYSTWDTFFGGGLIATHLKHEKLDESQNQLHQAQIALQRFKNELLDIQEMSTRHLTVNTDGFVKFADYIFDDIFSAWSIHSKISSSKEHVSRVLSDVRNTILNLEKKKQRIDQKLSEINNKKNLILGVN